MYSAFIDESIRKDQYLLTAAVVPTTNVQQLTKQVREGMPKGPQQRTHLSDENAGRRRQILRGYVKLGVPCHVAVAVYPGGDDQPTRDSCMRALLARFIDLRVTGVVIDTRQEHRDVLDRRVIAAAVRGGTAPPGLHHIHRGSRDEPLLSLPDAYGWAYGSGGHWRKLVAPVVTLVLP